MSRADVYLSVTSRMIEELEKGNIAPWRKPWIGGGPVNVRNGRPYRGINVFLLGLQHYGDPRWGTFKAVKEVAVKAAQDEGREIVVVENTRKAQATYYEVVNGERVLFTGGVRKGEKATHVILWKPVKRRDEEDSSYMLLKTFPVFNAEQCDGVPERETGEEIVPLEAAEAIVTGYIGPTLATNNVDMAAYSPTLDLVTMPPTASFTSTEGYYSTLFHELVHSTGHKSRLDRLESGGFGTSPYSKEELVAEMGAAMCCGLAGIENLDQSASYVSGWLKRLQDDRKLVVQAAAQAQKACDLMLGTKFDEPSQDSEMEKEVVAA